MHERFTGKLHATLLGNHSLWPHPDESRKTVGGTAAGATHPVRRD
ncbi:hypothetical protein HMPREF1980_00410 [Actinomyces sp. oral taxon 172 str. F0311]|nr:hypothetical protein HMPREF1980_00410 [Actinomyces sp. oral taxon 172 str. F0311]